MPEDWISLSENLHSFVLLSQMFASPDTQIVVNVERFQTRWLNDEDMRTWKDGVKLKERADVHTFMPVATWTFSESQVSGSMAFTYPQGMNVFWAEAELVYVCCLSHQGRDIHTIDDSWRCRSF